MYRCAEIGSGARSDDRVTDTIAAISTAFGQGAVALLRVSGPDALKVGKAVFRGKMSPPRVQNFGVIADAEGERIDEVLVTFFEGPASYTGEDMVEIGCHGGLLVTQRILDSLLAASARAAAPGEFTQRAFLNGKMDLTQAEAVMDLIEARTSLALKAANAQLEGRLGKKVAVIRSGVLGLLAHVEAYIDFPEEDIDPETGDALLKKMRSIGADIEALLATSEQGRILREGVATVICGAPNVGKSSLLNVLLGFERAIVSDVAGTTRDTIEEFISMRGIPLRLIDTAGVRESEDVVEKAGIARTTKQMESADLILEVVDGSQPRGETSYTVPGRDSARHVLILNKEDLGIHPDWEGAENSVRMSCLDEDGVAKLADEIFRRLTGGDVPWGANIVAINARHRACLLRAKYRLEAADAALTGGLSAEYVALDLREAMDAVGEISGRADVEELLGEIFSSFCIGK